mmetsp:Transcript_10266/g.31390  ORF Transcript_10266/g.31390 Transcript_10266/m.31390 type:complete len:825 (-) Transcript_10266:723-3197(-)
MRRAVGGTVPAQPLQLLLSPPPPPLLLLLLLLSTSALLLGRAGAVQYEARLAQGVGVSAAEAATGAKVRPTGNRRVIISGIRDEEHAKGLWKSKVLAQVKRRAHKGNQVRRDMKQCAQLPAETVRLADRTEVVRLGVQVDECHVDKLAEELRNLTRFQDFGPTALILVVELPHVDTVLEILDSRDEVAHVDKLPRMTFMNNYAAVTMQSGQKGPPSMGSATIWSKGITGANVILGVADTGIDFGNCYFRNGDKDVNVPKDHCNFSSRKIVCYYSPAFYRGDFQDEDGHGTSVVASAAGLHYRTSPGGNPNPRNLARDSMFRNGVAPGAKIVFQDISLSSVSQGAQQKLFEGAYRAWARVHSNSYGCKNDVDMRECNRYSFDAREVDDFMWQHKDFLVVFAAGNFGSYGGRGVGDYNNGFYTVVTPGTAKNGLTVGATSTDDTSAGCAISPCSSENLYAASSRGFSMDGRVKPDLVAPGEMISTAQTSQSLGGLSHAKVCSQAGARRGVARESGTSLSTPIVAGTAVLARQYLMEFNPTSGKKEENTGPLADGFGPTAALVKAVLIASTRPLRGHYMDQGLSSSAQRSFTSADFQRRLQLHGWGLPQLDSVLNFDGDRFLFVSDRLQFEEDVEGTDHKFVFGVNASASVRVVLTYTDYPGEIRDSGSTEPVLINNLDLHASCETPSACAAQSANSGVDVVENIFMDVAARTTLTVTVTATELDKGPQPYSLVVSGPRHMSVVDIPDDHLEERSRQRFTPSWTKVPRNISGTMDDYAADQNHSLSRILLGCAVGIGSPAFLFVLTGLAFVINARFSKKANVEYPVR